MPRPRSVALLGMRLIAALSIVLGLCVSIFFFEMADWSFGFFLATPPERAIPAAALIVVPIATGLAAIALSLTGKKSPWPELTLLLTIPLQVLANAGYASTLVLR